MQSYNSATGSGRSSCFRLEFFACWKRNWTEKHFQKLVDENREYIRSGDEWFHIDPLWLKKIRDLMDRADAGEWTVKDLIIPRNP